MIGKITEDTLNTFIAKEEYKFIKDTTMIICILHLHNGFCVSGTASCIDKKTLGKSIAREKAIGKLWEFLGFLSMELDHKNWNNYVKTLT